MAVLTLRRLRDLRDVVFGTPADGDVLAYDAGEDVFTPVTPTNGGGGGGGAPTTADYLTGTAQTGLSNEIVVGAVPGGELGGTWATPTVDATHSGSSHASVQAAAETTAAAALATHEADTTNVHGITDTTGLYRTGGTDVAVTDGGTGASTASGARTNLGLGTAATANTGDFDPAGAAAAAQAASQPLDSDLTAIAALSTTTFGRSLLALADAAAARTTLALVPGTDVQAYDAELAALAGLTSAADKLPYFTGSGSAAVTTLSSFMRTVLDDADAATAVATLGALGSTAAAGGFLAGNYPNPRAAPGRLEQTFLMSLASGALSESIPRFWCTSNYGLLSTNRLSLVAVPVLNGTACTNVSFSSGTTALSAGTNWWFALCDASFNVIRQSTDQLSAAWAANTVQTLAVDSIPVTAGSRSGSTTVTLTFPTLSQALTSLVAAGDQVVVSNANIAAYNGTFTVGTVSSTQITYTAGSSATDSLAAAFPTVKLASGKRVYTPSADGLFYAVIMVKASTVPTILGKIDTNATSSPYSTSPLICASGDTGLSGTCPSPIAHATGAGGGMIWAAIT